MTGRKDIKGFPIEPYVMLLDEVEEYFKGEKLTCLLCGHLFFDLGQHLTAHHKIKIDDFKEAYGLPFSKGLLGAKLRARRVVLGKANYQRNKVKWAPYVGKRSDNFKNCRISQNRRLHASRNINEHIEKTWRQREAT